MFVLWLNPMRGRAEERRAVAKAETLEALKRFIEREMVEPYKDDDGHNVWGKEFRKGGPLEWFNGCGWQDCRNDIFGHGFQEAPTLEQVLENTRRQYEADLHSIPSVD
jgi:hypothetical protein